MRRIVPFPLYVPLAILFACLLSLGLYTLTAKPQLESKLARRAQLQSELSMRQQSLSLQDRQPLIDRLQQPLASRKTIIRQLRSAIQARQSAPLKYSFGTPHPLQLEQLALTAQPLNLSLTHFPASQTHELIQLLNASLPNHLQLTGWSSDGDDTRLEFEIYGQ